MTDNATRNPGPTPQPQPIAARPHRGVEVSGQDDEEGRKAFYIHIEVIRMLEDILGCVQDDPATGPWYAVRYSRSTFGIFEVFPSRAGRQAHVRGRRRDIPGRGADERHSGAPGACAPPRCTNEQRGIRLIPGGTLATPGEPGANQPGLEEGSWRLEAAGPQNGLDLVGRQGIISIQVGIRSDTDIVDGG